MKKKARKFGTGGAILTGLGAGFVGSAIYDKLMKNKEDKEDKFQSLKSVDSKGRSPQEQINKQTGAKSVEPETKAEIKAEPKTDSREDYLEKRGAKPIKTTGTFSGADTTAPDTDVKDTTPAPVKKVSTPKPAVSSNTAIKMAPPDNADLKPKPVPKAQPKKPDTKMPLPSDERPYKPYPADSKYGLEDKAKTETKSEKKPAKPKTAPVTRYSKDKEKEGDSKFVPRHLRNTTPFKKGGMVKKYNDGGAAKAEPKKDTMPEWAKNERENKKKDELNKRESEGAKKEVKRNMSTFGFKKGGTASSRADGIAQRGKTRGRIY
jgi:hypothetical protein